MKNNYFINLILLILLTAICVKAEIYSNERANLTVDINGLGDVKTVGEAINKVPEDNKKRFVIYIKKGIYIEQIRVPAK